jgi:Putative beta-lactamase-inhibitor-like, PepSY-like
MTINASGVACALGTLFAVVVAAGVTPAAREAPAQSAAASKLASAPLPPGIKAAFTQAYPDATVMQVNHEKVHGHEQYEIESVDHGLKLDVNYKPDGSVIIVQHEVAAADVPAAVTAAIAARYPQATATLSMRTTEKKSTYYEIDLKGAPVESVQLTPDGKWISPKPGK